MCNLNKLRASKEKLPLPKPFDSMWHVINKCIDGLHIRNHKDKNCQEQYNPSQIGEMHPDLADTRNTMAAEQTFVWLGRYKKIMLNMGKDHHLFFLHRMISRRNRYTSKCLQKGKSPLLPKVRNEFSQ